MTLNGLLKNKQNTINEFLRMINAKEVRTSVQAQYLISLKYATNKTRRLEVLVKEGVNHPNIEDKNNDEETNERITGWLHGRHLTETFFLDSDRFIGRNQPTIQELQRQLELKNTQYINMLRYFARNIKGSDNYWRACTDDLEQWNNHHVGKGHGPPTFFITLSCAKNWWPDQ